MCEISLTLNAMDIAPIANEIEVYCQTSKFEDAFHLEQEALPVELQNQNEEGWISFTNPETPTPSVKIKWDTCPVNFQVLYLQNCIYQELSEIPGLVLGEKWNPKIEVFVPLSIEHTMLSRAYLKYMLIVKPSHNKNLLWIHYEGKRHVSKTNFLEMLLSVEPDKMQSFLHHNKICHWQSLKSDASINYARLFPVVNSDLNDIIPISLSEDQDENPYTQQWTHLLHLCHKYLLKLESVILTGEDELFASITIKMHLKPQKQEENCEVSFINLSILSSIKKKKVPAKELKQLISTLNKNCFETTVRYLFYYRETDNIFFKPGAKEDEIIATIQHKVSGFSRNAFLLIDSFLSPEICTWVKKALQIRAVNHLESPYPFRVYHSLRGRDWEQLTEQIRSRFQIPQPMAGEQHQLIIGISGIKRNGVEKIGVTCCCTKDGIFKQQEMFYVHELHLLPQKINVLLSMCKLEGFQPCSVVVHLNPGIGNQNIRKIWQYLAEIHTDKPVYWVEVTPVKKNPYQAFDCTTPSRIPACGTTCEIDTNEFLMYINPGKTTSGKNLTMRTLKPLHIKLKRWNNANLTQEEKETLLNQVYHFSYHSALCTSTGPYPATLTTAQQTAMETKPIPI